MGEEGGDLPHYMELFLKVHCADRLTPKPAQPAGPPPQCPSLASLRVLSHTSLSLP